MTDVPRIPWPTGVQVVDATPERFLLALGAAHVEVLPDGRFNLRFLSDLVIPQFMTRDEELTQEIRAGLQGVDEPNRLEWLRLWAEPHPTRSWKKGTVITEAPRRQGMPKRIGALGVDDTDNWDPYTYRGTSFKYAHFTNDLKGAVILWSLGDGKYSEPEVWIGDFEEFMAFQTVDPPDDPEWWLHYNQEFDDGIVWAATQLGAFDRPGLLADWPLEAVCSDPQALLRESIDRMLPRLAEYPECLQDAVREWLEVNPPRPEMGGAGRRGYRAAGILLFRPEDSKVLLLRRAAGMSYPGHWAVPGGTVERGENDLEAALREGEEETGGLPKISAVRKSYEHSKDSSFVFTTFLAEMHTGQRRWRPRLNDENDAQGWFKPAELPSPLMPGTSKAVRQLLGRPELGVMASYESFSVCRVISNDPSGPEYLTTAVHVQEDLTGRNVTVVMPVIGGKPFMAALERCYRSDSSFQSVVEESARAAEKFPVSVLCVEGVDRKAMVEFAVAALPEEQRAAIASAFERMVDACLRNV